jgi:hypothetical protein
MGHTQVSRIILSWLNAHNLYSSIFKGDHGNSSNKLRELLNLSNDDSNANRNDPIDYFALKYNVKFY